MRTRRWRLMWPLARRVEWCPHCRREVPDFEAHKWWAHASIYADPTPPPETP